MSILKIKNKKYISSEKLILDGGVHIKCICYDRYKCSHNVALFLTHYILQQRHKMNFHPFLNPQTLRMNSQRTNL